MLSEHRAKIYKYLYVTHFLHMTKILILYLTKKRHLLAWNKIDDDFSNYKIFKLQNISILRVSKSVFGFYLDCISKETQLFRDVHLGVQKRNFQWIKKEKKTRIIFAPAWTKFREKHYGSSSWIFNMCMSKRPKQNKCYSFCHLN